MGQQDEQRRVVDEIGALRDLDVAALGRRWRLLTGRHLSTPVPRPILVRLLAYRIQSDAFGDVAGAAARTLNRIAKHHAKGDVGDQKPTLESLGLSSRGDRVLSPGAVLVREHDGVHHHVMVLQDGFAWNGVTYRSLSEAARAITGTRWNGRRFFGLTAQQQKAGDR